MFVHYSDSLISYKIINYMDVFRKVFNYVIILSNMRLNILYVCVRNKTKDFRLMQSAESVC